jgi:BolA protein
MKLPIDRHRSVNSALAQELGSNGPIHALSIIAKTPEQWESLKLANSDGIVHITPSPNCRGGDGSLPRRH